jgi:hypothetical protein
VSRIVSELPSLGIGTYLPELDTTDAAIIMERQTEKVITAHMLRSGSFNIVSPNGRQQRVGLERQAHSPKYREAIEGSIGSIGSNWI